MNKINKIGISVVIAVFNEEDNITALFLKLKTAITNFADFINFEIIICEDHSLDSTLKSIQELSHEFKNLRILSNDVNQGAGYSFMRGISVCNFEYILLIDGDNQYDLNEILEDFLKIYDKDINVYFGERNFSKLPLLRSLGPRLTKTVYKKIFGKALNDYSCVVKIVKSDILKNLQLIAKRMNYSNELSVALINLKIPFLSFEVDMVNRAQGVSKTKFFRDAYFRFIFTSYIWLAMYLRKKDQILYSHQEWYKSDKH